MDSGSPREGQPANGIYILTEESRRRNSLSAALSANEQQSVVILHEMYLSIRSLRISGLPSVKSRLKHGYRLIL